MKKTLIFILTSLLGMVAFAQTSTNGVYFQEGTTTEVGNQIYAVITEKRSPVLYFSNGLLSKLDTNADFLINSFFQDIENTNSYPEKAKFGPSTLNMTIGEGSAYFVYPETDTNSSCVISTPFADVELHRGSFYFVVNTNNALCLVIDGSITAHGEKKQEKKIEAGTALVVAPTPQGIFDTKFSFSSMAIYDTTISRYKITIKDLSSFTNSVMFIRIDGKTVGVTL